MASNINRDMRIMLRANGCHSLSLERHRRRAIETVVNYSNPIADRIRQRGSVREELSRIADATPGDSRKNLLALFNIYRRFGK
ncbi:hypothetical protein A3J90_05790 [candidate division WOR-1 bacterium RIFOXYC2_FULL_37_10]|nr:MAG: hypothetical protein A3J90_05790 [candidate division WOR-1 bacterium RIFOXYC2_FULL_37_10]